MLFILIAQSNKIIHSLKKIFGMILGLFAFSASVTLKEVMDEKSTTKIMKAVLYTFAVLSAIIAIILIMTGV
ncbi:MAG: hypothetical protein KBD15_00810 [Candidatus Magasanikbacteria bacterium]|nr:hypothetical protein [Candidatus Magasanikbacteria bacterium]